jgi:hypothetical protein
MKRSRKKTRSFGGIISTLPKITEDRNVDDAAKVVASLAARGILLDDPKYGDVMHIATTSVILDTVFKIVAKQMNVSEKRVKKIYTGIKLLSDADDD